MFTRAIFIRPDSELIRSSFLCRFRIESVNVFVLPRFDLCHVLSSSTNNFAHAQTFSRMSSLSGRMNIARVNIGFEILLKLALNTNQSIIQYNRKYWVISLKSTKWYNTTGVSLMQVLYICIKGIQAVRIESILFTYDIMKNFNCN
jgi:hypothetical protein